jgi:O-methyltransferase involved in polyketide biosynthesis
LSIVDAMGDAGLAGAQRTLLPVLKAKALDNRLPDPILGDEYAERVMRRLDPGYDRGWFGASQLGLVAVVRSRAHDDWARGFLAGHPDAVVLHLGCGLDARVWRVDPPAGVEWFDLDYPAVIALRRECLPSREHYTEIGSSVTDLSWLDRVPRGRPVLMIAEGLVPYLTEAEVRRLVTGVVDAFPAGQIQLDTVPVWAWRSSRWDPSLRRYGTRFRGGFDEPARIADWHPRLRYVGAAPVSDSPVLTAKAPAGVRRAYRLLSLLPGVKNSIAVVRFSF